MVEAPSRHPAPANMARNVARQPLVQVRARLNRDPDRLRQLGARWNVEGFHMTCTITLGFAHVLVVGVIGAVCLLVGMVIGANSRTRGEQ
jgi:hypothetical protein